MKPNATYKFERQDFYASFAIDTVREAIEAGSFFGIRAENPTVAAMLEVLQRFDWPISSRAFAQALPHAPNEFSIYDVQSTLSRLGIRSRVCKLGWRSVESIACPAILITSDRSIGVWVTDQTGSRSVIDPVTGAAVSFKTNRHTQVISFYKRPTQIGNWFVYDLFYRCRPLLLSLLGIKLVVNLITVLVAFSIFAVFDSVVPHKAYDTLVALGVAMGVAFTIDFVFRMAKSKLLAKISARLEFLISSLTFRRVASLPLEKLIAGTVAQQIARLRPLSAMASSVVTPIMDAVSDLPFAILLTIVLFFLAGPIGFLPLAVIVVFAVAFALLMPGVRRREDTARQNAEIHAQVMSDLIEHRNTIRANYDHAGWAERAKQTASQSASSQRHAEVAARNLATIGLLATPLVGGGTAIVGAALAMSGALSNGALIAAMVLSWRIVSPVQANLMLVSKWSDLFRLSGQLNRLMAMPTEFTESDLVAQPALKGQLEFSAVAYRFGGETQLALRNASVSIPAGSFVAVTGQSGSGKTTLLRLVCALLRPLAGTVRIDDLDLRQLPIDVLRSNVSYVPINPVLVHGTVNQNIRLASPFASDDDVLSVLEETGLSKLVSELPNGINTRLTDEVIANLPKGFRQALAISQALLNQPSVLLLDEPARSLDPQMERLMIQALHKRRGKMTTLMVTHRASHVQAADYELVLEGGTIRAFSPVLVVAS